MDNENKEYISDLTCIDSYRKGWRLIFASFWILLGITLIFLLIQAPANSVEESYRNTRHTGTGLGFFAALYWGFLAGPVSINRLESERT